MYLVDTMIVSHILRYNPILELYRKELESGGPLYVSSQTIGELHYGAELANWGIKRRSKIAAVLQGFSLLPVEPAMGPIYGEILAGAKLIGRPLSVQDTWVLATAKHFGLTVISHDGPMRVGDHFGIKVICRR